MTFIDDVMKIKIPTMAMFQEFQAKSPVRTARSAVRVGSISFAQYTAKRLMKDGLGFLPISNVAESATDCRTYIKAPIPKDDIDLLAYFHELGHCKSKQPQQDFGISGWCKGRLQCEYNAWIWALKYFRRLGFPLTEGCEHAVKRFFGSYLNAASSVEFAKELSYNFYKSTGILVEVEDKFIGRFSVNVGGVWLNEFTSLPKVRPTVTQEKPKTWKPWHELKDKQIKKGWRNQR